MGYRVDQDKLVVQLVHVCAHPDVYEQDSNVIGFISVIPQLGHDGDLCIISYLAGDEKVQQQRIGKALEQYVADLAWHRKCDRIQLLAAHQFYKKQGCQEYPTYFSKRLIYAE